MMCVHLKRVLICGEMLRPTVKHLCSRRSPCLLYASSRCLTVSGEDRTIRRDVLIVEEASLRAIRSITAEPLKSNVQSPSSDSIDSIIRNSENVSTLLQQIQPHLETMRSHQLELIYDRILHFGLSQKLRSNDYKHNYFHVESNEKVLEAFEKLVRQTIEYKEIIDKPSVTCLVKAIKVFFLLHMNPDSEAIKSVLKQLIREMTLLKLAEIIELLDTFLMSNEKPNRSGYYSNIEKSLRSRAERMMSRNEFNYRDIETSIKGLKIFLMLANQDLVNQFAKNLLMDQNQLTYLQSVKVLEVIKIAENRRLSGQSPVVPPSALVEKCNRIVIDALKSEPNDNFHIYAIKLQAIDEAIFDVKNFYQQEILDLISPSLIKNEQATTSNKHVIHNMIYNFARFNISNLDLLKKLYELACSDDKFRLEFGISSYFLLSQFRSPMIDVQHLGDLLLSHNFDQICKCLQSSPTRGLELLCEFILNDVPNEKMLDLLDLPMNVSELSKAVSGQINNKLNLTKFHLSTFSGLNDGLKSRIKKRFDLIHHEIARNDSTFKVHTHLLHKSNGKIQENGRLSNGVWLKEIAIYDRSTKDFIPLADYQKYFEKFDETPLTKDQELLTFLNEPSFDRAGKLETYSNFRLKKVLNYFNIKPIEVSLQNFQSKMFDDDFKENQVKWIAHLTKAALDSYK